MKKRILPVPFIILFFFPPVGIYAHGVRGQVASGGIVVAGEYSTGEPMSYAKVDISAPGSRLPFQSGRTDRNGRFCFFPDTPGQWKIVISDERGHRLEVKVSVNEAMKLKSVQKNNGAIPGRRSIYERAIMGVSIIFGISGILLWLRWKKIYGEIEKQGLTASRSAR